MRYEDEPRNECVDGAIGGALAEELVAFERQLAEMALAAPRIDREQLMFAAGAASARAGRSEFETQSGRLGYIVGPSWPAVGFWQATTAVATAASLMLALTMVWDSGQQAPAQATVAGVKQVEVKSSLLAPRQNSDRLPPGYLGLRQMALARGAGALETAKSDVGDLETIEISPPATSRQLLRELLPLEERTNT